MAVSVRSCLSATLLLLSSAAKPGAVNVVMFAVDDLRNEPGAFGGAAVTPRIDALAKDAAAFQRNYVQQAVCGPTRASILTSRRTDTTRSVTHRGKCQGSSRSPSCYWRDVAGNFTTIPQHFKESGCEAVSFGKVFDLRTAGGESCDFPYSWSSEPVQCSISGTTLKDFDGISHMVVPTANTGKMTDAKIANAAIAWLAARNASAAPAPFFLAVGFHRPHLPFLVDQASLDMNPPSPSDEPPSNAFAPTGVPEIAWTNSYEIIHQYGFNGSKKSAAGSWGKYADGAMNNSFPVAWTRELRRFYKAAVTHTDTQIGRVLDALEASGEASKSVVALWGDHGWHLSENGLWAKCTLFDAAARAPLLIKAPGITDGGRGRRITALTEHLDLFPTLAELAGLPAVPNCPADGGVSVPLCTQGTSLVPLLKGSVEVVRSASLTLWPHPGVGSPPTHPAAKAYGSYQFPGSMGFSMALSDGSRYTEWVNMSYPDGTAAGGRWVPLWDELRTREYYLDAAQTRNMAENASKAIVKTMSALRRKLRAGWNDLTGTELLTKERAGEASSFV